jgi:hypothetical protein
MARRLTETAADCVPGGFLPERYRIGFGTGNQARAVVGRPRVVARQGIAVRWRAVLAEEQAVAGGGKRGQFLREEGRGTGI